SVVSLLPRPLRVMLVSQGNRFLEKALRAVPSVELSVSSQLTDSAEEFDLTVLDNVVPVTWPEGNILAIHTATTNWFSGWGAVEGPPIISVRRDFFIRIYLRF